MARVISGKRSLAVSLLADRKIQAEVRRVADRRLQAEVLKVSKKHYRNAVTQVQNSISDGGSHGLGSIGSSGSKRISFKGADGSSRAITTNPWQALSKAYKKRSPKSRQFWNKTGKLAAASSRIVSSGVAKPSISKPTVVRSHHKGKETIKFNISLSRLRYPFDDLVRRAFLFSEETNISNVQKRGRRGLSRAYWAERFRPYISRMSASLGRRYHTNLRKIRLKS